MISVVIPVYRNADNIPLLLASLERLNDTLDRELEVVFVVDGSPDSSLLRLGQALPQATFSAQLLSLSRNFGSFAAIRAGMEAARGDYVAVLAADMQEPPELIVEFHELLKTGDHDIAIGRRRSRNDPPISRVFAMAYWRLYRRFIQPDIPRGGVDVFACTRAVRDQLLRLPERNSSLVGLLFWIGFRRVFVSYDRRARDVGTSSWTFAKRWRYLTDSVFGFSDLPIRILLRVGLVGLLTSVLFAAVVIVAKLLGLIPIPGYAATVVVVSFFGALNCFGLGLIGGYVWRTFENTKLRPNYVVANHETFEPGESAERGRNEQQVLPASTGARRDE